MVFAYITLQKMNFKKVKKTFNFSSKKSNYLVKNVLLEKSILTLKKLSYIELELTSNKLQHWFA